MVKTLLILHVIAGIIFVGPVTVAVSLFPRYARLAAEPGQRAAAMPVLGLLRRISAVYAVLGISVPVLGVGVASELGVLTDAWLIVAMALTSVAAGLLALVVLPEQAGILERLQDRSAATGDAWRALTVRLAMSSGCFALLWAVVVALMVVRPGSTTSV